jgi:ArsR family transcriptional regulator, arsenate/arsenite/antimonite-responsive transcriptional repressor / arsenate reductase (thioredoxin)
VTDSVQRRVAVHAALADPTRLAVVDRLSLGDLSPGELSASLAVPGNLMAHHLKVLEAAGVVGRSRSEGDRRRSYVRLLVEDPVVAGLAGGRTLASPVPRVVFVCTHNSARSHLAAAVWERVSDVPVASAGTHPAARVNPLAAAVAARHDLDLSGRLPTHVSDVLRPDDLVVSVCDTAHEELAPQLAQQVHWSVPDPVRSGADGAFEAALVQITARVDRLGRAVTSSLEQRP